MLVYVWYLMMVLDSVLGLNEENLDIEMFEVQFFWYCVIIILWFFMQVVMIFGGIWWVICGGMIGWESFGLFFGIGVVLGIIGIVYVYEFLYQKNLVECWLGDLLLVLMLYLYFCIEYLLVYYLWVVMFCDVVLVCYNEGFFCFFLCVLVDCLISVWQVEVKWLVCVKWLVFDWCNLFWCYVVL